MVIWAHGFLDSQFHAVLTVSSCTVRTCTLHSLRFESQGFGEG